MQQNLKFEKEIREMLKAREFDPKIKLISYVSKIV